MANRQAGVTDLDTGGAWPPPPDAPVHPRLDLGVPVPGYRLLRLIGRGAIGEVFEAEQVSLGRRVAVKVLAPAWAADPEQSARLRNEAAALARLQHPNVVQIYEVGDAAGRSFLALELVAAGSLADRLRTGPLPAATAVALARDLARALQAAHEAGIVHRDLKPANILLQGVWEQQSDAPARDGMQTPDPGLPTPKVSDFGLAHVLGGEAGLTRTGAILGTPQYMAPEQAAGTAEVGPAADVYALGAVLYECVTGRPPFQAASTSATLELVRRQEPVPPRRLVPSLSADLNTVVLKCLEKEPGRRYASAGLLADELDRLAHGEPVHARPVGVLGRGVRWCRRRPAAAALVGVLLLAALGAAGGLIAHNRRLGQANAALEAQEAQTRGEKDRADANYREARSAIKGMLARFDDAKFATVPRAIELRNTQYEDALRFFAVIGQRRDDPDRAVRSDVAATLVEAARIKHLLGRNNDAIADARHALGIFEQLATAEPLNEDIAAQRANCLGALGNWLTSGRPDEARECLTKSAQLWEQVLIAQPESSAFQQGLAVTLNNLANLEYHAGRLDPARQLYQKCVALREALLRQSPGDTFLRVALAQTQVNLSQVAQVAQDAAEATRQHDDAERSFLEVLAADANNLQAVIGLSLLRVNWAYQLHAQGKTEQALDDLAKNVELLRPLFQREPGLDFYRLCLLRTYGARGQLSDLAGQPAEAVAAFEQVVALANAQERPNYTADWLAYLVKAKEHARALAVCRDFVAALGAGQAALFARAAGVYGTLGGIDGPLAARCTEQAVELLRRAKATLPPADWGTLRRELTTTEGWAPLRARPEIRTLLDA